MLKIINTRTMQQKVGEISRSIGKNYYIVTKNGKAQMAILPYYEGCERELEDFVELYEIHINKDKLEKRWKESLESGESDLKFGGNA